MRAIRRQNQAVTKAWRKFVNLGEHINILIRYAAVVTCEKNANTLLE